MDMSENWIGSAKTRKGGLSTKQGDYATVHNWILERRGNWNVTLTTLTRISANQSKSTNASAAGFARGRTPKNGKGQKSTIRSTVK